MEERGTRDRSPSDIDAGNNIRSKLQTTSTNLDEQMGNGIELVFKDQVDEITSNTNYQIARDKGEQWTF